jgi:flagellar basal-body rod protein FlgC
MGLFTSINIAATGMSAERTRLDVISNNIANANTTRTTEGGVFLRSRVVMRPRTEGPYWRSPFLPEGLDNGIGSGVRIAEIQKDTKTETRYVYDPTHPDAIMREDSPWFGYVEMPNVDIVTEMVDMINASRAYEANAQIIEGSKSMFQRALEIGSR